MPQHPAQTMEAGGRLHFTTTVIPDWRASVMKDSLYLCRTRGIFEAAGRQGDESITGLSTIPCLDEHAVATEQRDGVAQELAGVAGHAPAPPGTPLD